MEHEMPITDEMEKIADELTQDAHLWDNKVLGADEKHAKICRRIIPSRF